ncbi:MAG: DUF4115 domain-containing protein, partial [Deltaproteobacteria bacterium]
KVVALKRGAAQRKTKAARITAVKPPRKTDPVKAQKPAVADFTFKPTIASAGSGVKLTISAREDCWIKVKSDGKLLYYGILKKGRFDSWQAKDKINLFLGNAGVVDLNANGQVITNLGRKGQVLGDIVITKEGLSVR